MNIIPKRKQKYKKQLIGYDDKVEGLGLEFLFEVRYAESKIIQAPEMWPTYEEETRRYLLKRFPFGVIYFTSEEKIQIVAVAHYKRKPGYWRKRLKNS